jgi:hypothetical protein
MPQHNTGRMVTREHGFNLAIRQCISQLRANFFGSRVVNQWNSLLAYMVEALSMNCLKGRFGQFSGDNKFSNEWNTAFENVVEKKVLSEHQSTGNLPM